MGTKDYRKPEWVTHMEEMQEALKGKKFRINLDLRIPFFLKSGEDFHRWSREILLGNSKDRKIYLKSYSNLF